MTSAAYARLRGIRYALPDRIGQFMPVATIDNVVRTCVEVSRRGMSSSVGLFASDDASAGEVAMELIELADKLRATGCDAVIALKPPQLAFDGAIVGRIADRGMPVVLDALRLDQADRILALALESGVGIAIPARWRRSKRDVQVLRDLPCRIRLVKGEWADPVQDTADIGAAYLSLVRALAGRKAVVGVATHDPALARAALTILRAAGTPVELEQLRGLPARRTIRVAREMGVPVRRYMAFGPGWWPYAIEQALRRPYLPVWALRDLVGR